MRVTGSELIGLVPKKVLIDAGKYFLHKQQRSTGIAESEIIKIAQKTMGLDEIQNFDPKDKILVGERGGKKLDGFDLGNSPLGVSPDRVKGKRVFMSTTNGTRSLHRVRESKSLYTMALPNRKAIADRLKSDNPNEVWIVGSGWEGSYSLEDSLAAGALASLLMDQLESVQIVNDELMASIALWKNWENDVEGCLRIASHGQRLAGIGNHDDDFACCASLDNLSVIPKQIEMGVLRSN